MIRIRVHRSGTVAALAALALGACAGDVPTSPDPSDPLQRGVQPVLLVQSERMDVHMQALFDGDVVMDAEGCLRIDATAGSTVVWPVGTRLAQRGGDLVVLDADGRRVGVIGERFRLGGGVIPDFSADVPVAPSTRAEAIARCPGTYWLVGDIPGR